MVFSFPVLYLKVIIGRLYKENSAAFKGCCSYFRCFVFFVGALTLMLYNTVTDRQTGDWEEREREIKKKEFKKVHQLGIRTEAQW